MHQAITARLGSCLVSYSLNLTLLLAKHGLKHWASGVIVQVYRQLYSDSLFIGAET